MSWIRGVFSQTIGLAKVSLQALVGCGSEKQSTTRNQSQNCIRANMSIMPISLLKANNAYGSINFVLYTALRWLLIWDPSKMWR